MAFLGLASIGVTAKESRRLKMKLKDDVDSNQNNDRQSFAAE
jgi:hypothetical protein